jgi:uncharacterized membrane protein
MRLIRLLKRDLAHETRDWVEEGLIDQAQGEAICARYGIDYQHPEEHSGGYRVLVVLGFLFIGLSLLTLIGANWEEIPRAVRTAGLVLLVLAANLRGWFSYRSGQRGAAVGWFFLGSLFYGAAIMLIAQIYHIGEHFPDGILWWALGVLPFALLLESGLLTVLMLALAYIWLFVETGLDFFPWLFPLFLAAAGLHLYRHGHSNLIFIAVVAGIGLFAEFTLSWFMSESPGFKAAQENIVLAGGLFVFFLGVGKWLASRPSPNAIDYGALLQVWVLRFFVLYLLFFSFEGAWNDLLGAPRLLLVPTLVVVLLLCAAALVLAILAHAGRASVVLTAVAFLGMWEAALWVNDDHYDVWFQVADNLLLIGLGIWLILRGIQARISHYFHVGVSVILLTGLLRYIDLVGDYIGAAILFAVFAAILLLAARFWKSTHREGAA